jgi:hypothetical protein
MILPVSGLYDTLTLRNPDGSWTYQAEFDWLQTLDAFRTMGRPYFAEGRRQRDLPYTYTPFSNEQEVVYSHPHGDEMHQAAHPLPPKGLKGRSAHAERTHAHVQEQQYAKEQSVGVWAYSPVQGSVWTSPDASSLGLFFTCSSIRGVAGYMLSFSQMDVTKFGISAEEAALPWDLQQFDQRGSVIGVTKFANGTSIGIEQKLSCRGANFFTLTQSNEFASGEPLVAEM